MRRFIDCLEFHAIDRPDAVAYRFIGNDIESNQSITFGTLQKRAKVLAGLLQEKAQPGDRALLIYTPGIEFIVSFLACLYSGVVAVPIYPVVARRLSQELQRLEAITNDAKPALILADHLSASLLEWQPLPVIVTDRIESFGKVYETLDLTSDPIAFIQYSSGSTGNPKGIVVSNENLIVNTAQCVRFLSLGQQSSLMSWVPHYHDMGLVGFILTPLTLGITGFLMSPFSFVEDPLRWLKAISYYRITHTGGPNFGYELCAKWIKRFPQASMDLSCLKLALCGAEPINPDIHRRLSDNFRPYGFNENVFFPVYGLAEHTLIASGSHFGEAPVIRGFDYGLLQAHEAIELSTGKKIVGCGTACEGHEIAIVDPSSKQKIPDDTLGEIWLKGPSVAKGYWNKPEETKLTFQAYTDENEGPYLRSGDLGFKHQGQLFIFGRIKDIMIIRGRQYAPQDIEYSVQNAHEVIKKGNIAAFSVDIDSVERLVIVAELSTEPGSDACDQLINKMIRTISDEYQLAVYEIVLIKPKSIPKTTSGKIQRYACKRAYLNHELESIASWRTPAVDVSPPMDQTPKSLSEWQEK